jgi:GT2 family glycosyltransferase
MDLSVIIVSYNVKYFLAMCLSSVRKAIRNINCEIFVVDNNSSDGSCEMIKRDFPGVKLISNRENRGFSAANNQAIKKADGKYILLLNPDTIIGEDTLSKCIRFMDEHPDAGAAGVMMINGNGIFLPESKRAIPLPETAFWKISGLYRLFPASPRINRYYLGHLNAGDINRIDVVSGAFMFIRGKAVSETGLLDEDYFMYGEDIDYSYRLLGKGYGNYYFPDAGIIHFKGESTQKEEMDFVIRFYDAMLIFVRKHFSSKTLRKMVFPISTAIRLRAAASVIHRFFRKISKPFCRRITRTIAPGRNASAKGIKTAVICGAEMLEKINKLLALTGDKADVFISTDENETDSGDNIQETFHRTSECINNEKIRQVIFSSGQMKFSSVIACMQLLSHHRIRFRIASPDGNYMIGSGTAISAEE